MIKALTILTSAIATAKFADADVRKNTEKLIAELDAELTEEQYEEGSAVEEATGQLEESLNAVDSTRESASSDEDEDDEFAGLGDEDDED